MKRIKRQCFLILIESKTTEMLANGLRKIADRCEEGFGGMSAGDRRSKVRYEAVAKDDYEECLKAMAM